MRGLVRNIVNQLFDKFYHLDSTSHVELEEMGLGHQERVHYAPSGWLTMPRLSKHIPFLPVTPSLILVRGKAVC